MTEHEWLELAAWMTETWDHQPLPPGTALAWYPLLADLDVGQAAAALRALALEPARRYRPSVGEIREVVEGPLRRWEDALAELAAAVRALGVRDDDGNLRKPPAFADRALHLVVADRGWPSCCNAPVYDSTWRAQFRDAYTMASRSLTAEQRRRQAGLPAGNVVALPARSAVPDHAAEPEDAQVLPLPVGDVLAQAVDDAKAKARETLEQADPDVDLPPVGATPASHADTPAERRARNLRAQRIVAEARAEWARVDAERLRDPARIRRVEQLTAEVRAGRLRNDDSPPAHLDARLEPILAGAKTVAQVAAELSTPGRPFPPAKVAGWVKALARARPDLHDQPASAPGSAA